jgi:hypothetical protein
METLLLFGNVSQPPYCNNLFPPVRAFQRAFRTVVVEPQGYAGFVPTGGARPALVPDDAVAEHTDPPPDVVVCLGGALHFSKRALRSLSRQTALVGFALSDPYGLDASLAIAPEFDLFYTQDPQTLGDYAARGIPARRCDPATDPELYGPARSSPEPGAFDCDVLYYGKWTPYRDALVAALAQRLRVRLHAYAGERRWSTPSRAPLDTPERLRTALNGARMCLETARLDDAEGKYRDAFRITPRAFFAASCAVPSLIESFPGLDAFFQPRVEIGTFDSASAESLVASAQELAADENARATMGRRARARALRDHTWDRRVEAFVLDLRKWRREPQPNRAR